MRYCAILVLFVLACCGCDQFEENTPALEPADSAPDTLVTSGYDEDEMNAAMTRARNEVHDFIAELANPTGKSHAVKAPIHEGGNTEYFWLVNLSYENGEFEGTINNDPGIVGNVKIGQQWKLKKDEIADWLYMKDGKMHGNYTMRPLLKTMPAEEAAYYRSMLAEP